MNEWMNEWIRRSPSFGVLRRYPTSVDALRQTISTPGSTIVMFNKIWYKALINLFPCTDFIEILEMLQKLRFSQLISSPSDICVTCTCSSRVMWLCRIYFFDTAWSCLVHRTFWVVTKWMLCFDCFVRLERLTLAILVDSCDPELILCALLQIAGCCLAAFDDTWHLAWQRHAGYIAISLTHWGRDKWPPFSRRHFQMHFLEWKCINFD